MRNSLRFLFVAILATSIATVSWPAIAEVVEYEFTGKVFERPVEPLLGIYPQIGDPVTGRFAYDTEAMPTIVSSWGWAAFPTPPPLGFRFTVNGKVFESTRTAEAGLPPLFTDGNQLLTAIYIASHGLLVDGVETDVNADLWLTSRNIDAFGTRLSLPRRLTMIDLDYFGYTNGSVSEPDDPHFVFSIDSLTLVPVPSTASLATAGLVVIFLIRASHRGGKQTTTRNV